MPLTSQITLLHATRAKVVKLEEAVATGLANELARLPTDYGFESVNDFVQALKNAASGIAGTPTGSRKHPAKKVSRRRRRATINDDTRAQVKRLVREGKTGSQIAEIVGISLPSVQNIKKALGLVNGLRAKSVTRKPEKKLAARKAAKVTRRTALKITGAVKTKKTSKKPQAHTALTPKPEDISTVQAAIVDTKVQ
jgi:hypothetical protein